MSWPVVELQELALQQKGAIVSGPFGSNIGSRFFVDTGVPIIRGNNLTKGEQKFIDSGFVYLTESKAAEFPNCIAIPHDLVFTAAGSIGQVGLIPAEPNYERYVISNKQLRVRLDETKAIPLFVYYWLSSKRMIRYLISMNNGGAVPLLNLGIIRRVPVPQPDIETQKRIASILTAYDDLIENNRRRIQLLEQAARLLYKEWFVHLRFPGHEHVTITDCVPEGWTPATIAEIGDVVTGKTPSKKRESFYGDDMPFIKTPDMHGNTLVIKTEESLSEEGANTQANKTLPPRSILVSCIGTVGAVAFNSSTAQTNQQINAIVPRNASFRYWAFFMAKDLKPLLEAMGGGATMANVNKSKFSSIKVVIPSVLMLDQFNSFLATQTDQIERLALINLQLSQARDLLLPRLMNGELSV